MNKRTYNKSYELIYAIQKHPHLEFMVGAFMVLKDAKGQFTYQYQSISSVNVTEFGTEVNATDIEIIKLIEQIDSEKIFQKFGKQYLKSNEFYFEVFEKDKNILKEEILRYLDHRRNRIFYLLSGKRFFEIGKDGYPAWKEIDTSDERANILFHFIKNEDSTHYFPIIKLNGEKINLFAGTSYLVCNDPAWVIFKNQLFTFKIPVNGKKIIPFKKKKFILVPKQMEDKYYKQFVAPLIAEHHVFAKGFDILTHRPDPIVRILLRKMPTIVNADLFETPFDKKQVNDDKIVVELYFDYGIKIFLGRSKETVSVSIDKKDGKYYFHKIYRNSVLEKAALNCLAQQGLKFNIGQVILPKSAAFYRIERCIKIIKGLVVEQDMGSTKYFLGESSFELEVTESIDWFDIQAAIKFGEYDVSLSKIKQTIRSGSSDITLPNGEIACIPDEWIKKYKELFNFSTEEQGKVILDKKYISLVNGLAKDDKSSIRISEKLKQLLNFEKIKEHKVPNQFKGVLRPYQIAGYNWLCFLAANQFGGCLADDMGLGKTVQTLALLQHQKNEGSVHTSLLVLPTSLLYNWLLESKKFTPNLKVLVYTGVERTKNIQEFTKYDLIMTSYGIVRSDGDRLSAFHFNYIILDESQAIKNPSSKTALQINQLEAKRKLALTGTPVENSTLDLWSQMNFINPGLLGSERYFKKEYLLPIEKKKDALVAKKLHTIIKPFVLRRKKEQVAAELPEKNIDIHYCTMTEAQQEIYNSEKFAYKTKILSLIDEKERKKSNLLILQGLTRLRQIANHPKMVDPNYKFGSGKFEEIVEMIDVSLSGEHKILVFSQFTKHLSIIAAHLKSLDLDFAYLDGSTKNREAQVKKFQDNQEVSIFLISLKAGGTGLNMTSADYVFLLDPWWNPAVEMQAIDRAHRIGQQKKVFAYKFITKDSIEEKILILQENKEKLAKTLISVEDSFIKKLSQDNILQLFN